MGHPGVSPEAALHLNQTVLYWLACTFVGSALLAFLAYLLFLCLEIFFPQPRSKTRLAIVPQPLSRVPVAEENFERFAAEMQTLPGTASAYLFCESASVQPIPDQVPRS
jgi:hypothetical protein